MTQLNQITFDMLSLGQTLDKLTNDQLNSLDFGVIGFDNEGMVKVYNAYESKVAGLSLESVIDSDLFNSVAPCMNNFMVAQKFEDAVDTSSELDEIMVHLIEHDFLNEERFARSFARGKHRIKYWGNIRIINELKARNI